MTHRADPTVLISAWFEEGSSEPLRARIRFADEQSGGFGESSTVTSPDAAAEILRAWLARVVADRGDELPAGTAQ